MPLSNAEKQARFRKKEQLSKAVREVSLRCQLVAGSKLYLLRRTFGDLGARLREAASLPSEWTDEDLRLAYKRVNNIHGDVLGAVDLLSNDADEARGSLDSLRTTPNPKKWLADNEKAKRDTIALAGHLVSALEVSQLPHEECAAATVETLRHAGRSLANSALIGESDATAVCMAALNRHYERPDWFIPRLAGWLHRNLDEGTRKALGERLLKDGGGSSR